MKPLQIIHALVTLLLLAIVVGMIVLVLVGAMTIPWLNQAGLGNAKATLQVVRGTRPNMVYPIVEGPNVIGRADQKPVDIDLYSQESPDRIWSSRQHAVIWCDNGVLSIEELNSTNGTFVNRERTQPGQKQPIRRDDLIQIGEIHFKVH